VEVKIRSLKYYVGCSGWTYSSWTEFYPRTLNLDDYLAYYSRVFNFVEIDLDNLDQHQSKILKSQRQQQQQEKRPDRHGYGMYDQKINNDNNSRYDNHKNDAINVINYHSSTVILPDRKLIKKWSDVTPSDFRFSVKLPIALTNQIDRLGSFLQELAPLEEKILSIRIHQSNLTLKDGRQWLEELLSICTYHGYSAAVEFDHYSWYQDLTYHILKKHKAAMIWTDIEGHTRHYYYPAVTTDFVYLRINKNERKWVQKIKEEEKRQSKEWVEHEHETKHEIGSKQNYYREDGLEFAIIVVDRPPEVNKILNLLSLPQRKYGHNQWIGRIILCVDLNAFFPSCEELRDPSLVGRPHAVIMTEQDKGTITRGAVASCSYEARRYGIKSAMSLSKAKELYPDLILNPVDIPYYREVSDKVMRILEEYADSLEQSSIDEAYLDCTLKVNSNPSITIEDYALQIKKSINEQCRLLTSIGVANTKSVAKIASDFKKPDGLTIVSPDRLSDFLQDMSVDAISGIGTKTRHILREEFGIETIGHLASQDVQRLIERFGKRHGLWMWQVANGRDNEAVIPREDNISISSEQTLYPFTRDKEKLLKYLNELVEEVHRRASRKGYEFRTVGIKIVKSDFSIESRETSYSSYQNTQESIATVIESLLDKFSFLNPEDNNNTASKDASGLTVRKVGIKLSNLARIAKIRPPEQKTLLEYM
jgi:DNA polymerase IV (DinB-like DNA polymerase)